MAAIHSDILTLTINETPVDLTAFIDLNKTTFLSDHHGRWFLTSAHRRKSKNSLKMSLTWMPLTSMSG